MLIGSSYFVGERNIPNTTYSDVTSRLANLVDNHERTFLIDLLGYELFTEFAAALKASADTEPDERYLDILFGKDFTGQDGRLKRWDGLVMKTSDEDYKGKLDGVEFTIARPDVPTRSQPLSPIADYVYCQWLKGQASQTGGIGEVVSLGQNSNRTSNRYKHSRAWNEMTEKVDLFYDWMIQRYDVYPEFQVQAGRKEFRMLQTKMTPFF